MTETKKPHKHAAEEAPAAEPSRRPRFEGGIVDSSIMLAEQGVELPEGDAVTPAGKPDNNA